MITNSTSKVKGNKKETLIIPNVDLELLDIQRRSLISVVCAAKSVIPQETRNTLMGLVNMLDVWSDFHQVGIPYDL